MMDPYELNRLIWDIARQAVAPAESAITDGVAVVVAANKASVQLPGAADPTPGFTIAPGVSVSPGDHVLVFRRGGFLLVWGVLNRTAVVPQSHVHLSMLSASTTISADQNDWAPTITDAEVLRVDVQGSARNVSGFDASVLVPGRRLWLAPATNNLVLLNASNLSAIGNRITAPGAAPFTIRAGGAALLYNANDGDNPIRVMAP
jgi:hypothetical protein